MFSGKKSFYVSLIAALSLTIAGCGDDKSATSKSALPPKQAVVNLSDAVLPSYVTVSGLGAPEPWGRWSISDRIVLKFGTDLPKKFSLLIDAKAYGPNAGTAIPVIFGDQVKEIKLSADA